MALGETCRQARNTMPGSGALSVRHSVRMRPFLFVLGIRQQGVNLLHQLEQLLGILFPSRLFTKYAPTVLPFCFHFTSPTRNLLLVRTRPTPPRQGFSSNQQSAAAREPPPGLLRRPCSNSRGEPARCRHRSAPDNAGARRGHCTDHSSSTLRPSGGKVSRTASCRPPAILTSFSVSKESVVSIRQQAPYKKLILRSFPMIGRLVSATAFLRVLGGISLRSLRLTALSRPPTPR